MMMKRHTLFILLATLMLSVSCSKKEEQIDITTNDFHDVLDEIIDIMVHDIFSPPVASRVFAYPDIAAYEIIAENNSSYSSLSGQIQHFGKLPEIKKPENLNYRLAALMAYLDMSKRLIFSEEPLQVYQDSLYMVWQDKNSKQFEDSKVYADQVVDFIVEWMNKDNYLQTRTMPKFRVATDDERIRELAGVGVNPCL